MKAILVFILILTIFSSCNKKINQNRKTPNVSPSNTQATIGNSEFVNLKVAQNNNIFAFDLFKKVKEENKNLFFSPYSISAALAMTYAGARNETEMEMSKTLKFSLDKNNFHRSFKMMSDTLMENAKTKGVEINIANSLWAQKDYSFLDEYYDLTKKYYNSGFKYVDFIHQSEKARKTINKWVEKKTEEMIPDLLAEGTITDETRLVLVNAIYFYGIWDEAFKKKLTKKSIFYLTKEKNKEVDFMNLYRKQIQYYENNLIQAIELPYAGKNISMMILLPKERNGIQKLEKYLSNSNYENWSNSLEERKVNVSLPKFEMESSYDLANILGELGMPLAFTDMADFSGMTGKKDLKISKVIHKAVIEVSEKGTEAAASTAVTMIETTSLISEKKVIFNANHPFIVIIRDKKTEAILFLGKVFDPEA